MRSSSRLSLLAGLLGIALILPACTKKPSEEQCEQFAEQLVKLFEESRGQPNARVRKLAQDHRQGVVDSCVRESSVKEVECVLAQTSLEDVETNCK